MGSAWQTLRNRWREQWAGWRQVALAAVACFAVLTVVYSTTWTSAWGQESPLATPPPVEVPIEAPPAFVPSVLPSISGVVRNASDEPLAGMILVAYRRQQNNWTVARQTTTNAAGEYRLPWMPAGIYRFLLRDPQKNYAATYFPNAADIEAGEDVLVAGESLTALDMIMGAGGRIAGTVVWPNGPAPFDSTVKLYYVTAAPITTRLSGSDDLNLPEELRQVRLVASESFTESVVSFEFAGLAAGRYRVCAQATSLRKTLHECFDDAALGIHSTDVVVAVGARVDNVGIELGDGADLSTLAGRVTLADQTPATGVDVEVVAAPNVDFSATPPPVRTTTDSEGLFRFTDLPFGRYVVRFADADGLYLASDYRATAEETTPTVIELGRSSEITISAVISAASLITGTVVIDGAIAGMGGQVSAFGFGDAGWFVGGTGNIVAATGAYTVTGLTGGNYRLQYQVDIPTSIFYGEPGATLETATEIAVVTGTSVGNIVMDLTPYLAGVAYGSISGVVTQDNVPQPDVPVRIYDAGGDCCVAPPPFLVTVTDAEGRFSVSALPPGRYKVGVGTAEQPAPMLYAPDQRTFETAAIYVIGNPADGISRQNVTDVNVALVPVGSVARRVLRPDDTPVVGATVNLYQRLGEPGNWPLVASTRTNEEGRYAFAGVAPDIYQVCIVAEGITTPTCSGRGGQGFGLDVVVSAGQEATGIDILDVP